MSDSGLFLKKKKPRPRPPPSTQHVPSPPVSSNPLRAGSSSSASPRPLTNGSPAAASDPSKIVEFKLVSSGTDNALRYNIMRLNSLRDVDPRVITRPILMNRKEPGPKAPPVFAQDESGKIVGRYVYDNAGKPVMDASGQHVVEKRDEKDLNLVGSAPASGSRRTTRKGVKEVHHQDIEVIRLRREEQTPWILESAKPKPEKEQGAMPEHWVGRMMEPTSMPTVLLVNDGTMGMGFKVVPLGRTYRFEPERPFKVEDSDTANKNYEQQGKTRFQDKFAHRQAGSSSTGSSTAMRNGIARSNAELWERNITARLMNQMDAPRVKRENFDDDYRREGRMMERGMEGGVDEELDYDFKEEFQDDEENNTFYQDPEEEEEAKAQEEQLKKEFKLANANVGDRPQISSDEEDEEDLFGDKLNQEGKRLRKMMKKRGGVESGYGTSESEEDSDLETVASGSKDKKEKEKESEKARSREPSAAPSDRPSRPSSRGPTGRVTSSPTGRRHQPPTPGKASTAPPGSGSALLAQRAAGGSGSPRHSRQTSPLGRAQSPEKGRAGSPTVGSREASPTPSASGSTRQSVPGQRPRPKNPSKRTPVHSLSPGPSPSNKRKTSPSPSVSGSGGDPSRKKKKSGSNTPTPGPEFDPFPGMITREEVVAWFQRQGKDVIPMSAAISAFKERIKAAGEKKQLDNQKVFLGIVQSLTRSEPGKMLRVREGLL